MAPKLPAIRARMPRAVMLWAAAATLLSLGFLTTLIDLTSLSDSETRIANNNGQRVIIDPVTGVVSGIGAPKAEEDSFEVDEDAAGPDEKSEAPAKAEEHADAEKPAATDSTTPTEETPTEATAQSALPDDITALRTAPEEADLPKIPSSKESIVAPPAPEITEIVKGKPLPKRGENGSAPSKLYAKRFTRDPEMAYLSIVITDAGFNSGTMAQILTLPHEITIAYSPYALEPKTQIAMLHTAGYETWGMLPVMGTRYPQDDPGPLGLIKGMTGDEQQKRLRSAMTATLGGVGFVLPSDESITTFADFAPLLKEIDKRGLLLLSTHPARSVDQITKDAELKATIRRADLVLDSTASAAFIQSKLAGLKDTAKQQRTMIVVASARPQTLSLLADWLASNPLGEDVKLAPLSAIYGPAEPEPAPVAEEKSGGHGGGGEAKKESSGGHGGGH